MRLQITERVVTVHETPFTFPLYRSEGIGEWERIYWKFESHHKVTRIHEQMCEISILTYDDLNADFVKDMITSEDMLYGRYQYDIIPESIFDAALQRLIDVIHRC